ncbi:MAG: hypothetical protein DVB25_04040 [Verrucomicrobia bacterium]|nr:MAG: hypothetical protein DVB25_04040 [Verrucomicrobiota bacterium]
MYEQLRASKVLGRAGAWPLGALCAVLAGLAAAAPPVMKDAATHEQLARQLRKTEQEDPMPRVTPSQAANPPPKPAQDLLSQSDILCFGGMATLVPKHAVLLLPTAMTSRSEFTAGSTLMGWAEFYAQNRGWISTVEVTNEQAAGSLPLAADVTQRLKDGTRVVVATYQGGPISVLPPKVPPPASPSDSAPVAPTQTNPSKP